MATPSRAEPTPVGFSGMLREGGRNMAMGPVPVLRIDDPSDDRLSDYRDLTDVALRRRSEPAEGLYIAESAKVLARALAAGHTPRSVLVQEKWLPDAEALAGDAPIYLVSDEVAEQLTGYAVHRGPSRRCTDRSCRACRAIVAGARTVLVLEDIVDHTNVKTRFRAAAGLGADAVLVTPRCADPLYRRASGSAWGPSSRCRGRGCPRVSVVPGRRVVPCCRMPECMSPLSHSPTGVPLDVFAEHRPQRVALVLRTRRATDCRVGRWRRPTRSSRSRWRAAWIRSTWHPPPRSRSGRCADQAS